MNSPFNPGDIVELPDGRRLMIVSPERAAAMCKDVQLWQLIGEVWHKDVPLRVFREAIGAWHAGYFTTYTPAIEVDPVKEEYTPNE